MQVICQMHLSAAVLRPPGQVALGLLADLQSAKKVDLDGTTMRHTRTNSKDRGGEELTKSCLAVLMGLSATLTTQECFAKAMNVHAAAPSGGYLLIGDDTLLDICLLATGPRDKLW